MQVQAELSENRADGRTINTILGNIGLKREDAKGFSIMRSGICLVGEGDVFRR